jgi:hypothetical protein
VLCKCEIGDFLAFILRAVAESELCFLNRVLESEACWAFHGVTSFTEKVAETNGSRLSLEE